MIFIQNDITRDVYEKKRHGNICLKSRQSHRFIDDKRDKKWKYLGALPNAMQLYDRCYFRLRTIITLHNAA